MLNKKAVIEDWLPTMLLIVILIFLFFFFIFSSSSNEAQAKEIFEFESIDIDSEQFLINYLRNPFQLEGFKDSNVADGINIYFTNPNEDLLNKIISETNQFFSKTDLERSRSSWSLEIKHLEKTITIESERVRVTPGARVYFDKKKEVSRISIPSNFEQENIEIRLFFVLTSNK